MSTPLPPRPNLHWLKNRAKDRLKELRAKKPAAKLAEAQLAVARDHGFASWRMLKAAVEAVQPDSKREESLVKQFREAINQGRIADTRRLLETEPLVRKNINAPIFAFDSQPIVHACHNSEMVDLLLEFGADINVKTKWWAGGFGVLEHAHGKAARHLIRRGAVVDIFAAANLGDIGRIKELLANDPALVNAKGGDGGRPLHFAHSAEAIDLLLDRGAEIDARDVDHESTPAQWALGSPSGAERVRHFIRRGASVDIFMLAAVNDVKPLRRLLKDDPAALTARVGGKGYAPCPDAPGRHKYVYSLQEGKTPHQVAADFGSAAALQLLLENSTPTQRFIAACSTCDESAARAQLAKSPELLASLAGDDLRALSDAAWVGNAKAVRLMLDLGWNPLAMGIGTGTGLHCAAWHGRAAMVRMILSHPSVKKLGDQPLNVIEATYKSTPLGWCCHGSTNCRNPRGNYPAVARMLLKAGAVPGPNAADASEEVSKDLAAYTRRARI